MILTSIRLSLCRSCLKQAKRINLRQNLFQLELIRVIQSEESIDLDLEGTCYFGQC
jgi:hypothetical protein